MPTIGIIANPASGKDIRRLVSYATTIDNREKVNIVKRITLAAQSMGIDRILFMPDTFQIGRTVMADAASYSAATAPAAPPPRGWTKPPSFLCPRERTTFIPP